jgi:hypothetical protein
MLGMSLSCWTDRGSSSSTKTTSSTSARGRDRFWDRVGDGKRRRDRVGGAVETTSPAAKLRAVAGAPLAQTPTTRVVRCFHSNSNQ